MLHNLGLSHDGQAGVTTYYYGHGSGPTRWAPIMGGGQIGEITQWSRGEYYLANNPQDDLAVLESKLGYRTDDHGDTKVASSLLTITDGTNIVSTTPGNDPNNANPANKGIIESDTDIDVFVFATGAGQINLDVNPWISPNANRGGNLDVVAELRDDTGALLASSNPADETIASISSVVPAGTYYLHIRGTGTGTPLASPPSGYTAYASIGQYFISGSVVENGGVSFPPSALVSVSDITTSGQGEKSFMVTYVDEEAVDVSTMDGSDVRVSGPNGYHQAAALLGVDDPSDGSPRTASYAVTPPGSSWVSADNGVYTIWMENNQVADIHGTYVAGGELGTFNTLVPVLPDPGVIAAPSNLAGTISGSSISLVWSDNANNEEGFKLYRGLESGKGKNKTVSWSLVATLGVNSNSYADTNIPNGTYYYYVEAFNSSSSATSAQIKLTVGRKGKGQGRKK